MRRRRGLVAVTACLAVLLSGCATLTGPPADDTPGIDDEELVDGDALLEAHVEAVTESGYSYDASLNQTQLANGERFQLSRQVRSQVAPRGTEYLFQEIGSGRIAYRVVIWGNTTTEYRRTESGGAEPQYDRREPSSAESLAGAPLLEPHLSAPFEVVDVEERDNSTRVRLEATDSPTASGAFPSEAENVRNYEARLLVDTEGRIHHFSATATYDLDGEPAEYEFTYEITTFEDPDVFRPSWVDELES